ncbi:MAG TPA: hypothetical protein VIT91_20240 [Chthoniobacterales bacterium]
MKSKLLRIILRCVGVLLMTVACVRFAIGFLQSFYQREFSPPDTPPAFGFSISHTTIAMGFGIDYATPILGAVGALLVVLSLLPARVRP